MKKFSSRQSKSSTKKKFVWDTKSKILYESILNSKDGRIQSIVRFINDSQKPFLEQRIEQHD